MEIQQSTGKDQLSLLTSVDQTQFFGNKDLTYQQIRAFQTIIYDYYKIFGRNFAWRQTVNPYSIVVSEIMLQQTQTGRVVAKYEQFLKRFPNFSSLAQAQLHNVIVCWQGLGYNRRGKYLWQLAKIVQGDFGGILPKDPKVLQTFPGIGKATAASICAFAFNEPTVFIETNIRTVFTKFFFSDDVLSVHDNQIEPFVTATLDKANARIWYYALTDYGVGLKKYFPNLNKRSAHYNKQSRFEGSDRQIRGKILRLLAQEKLVNKKELDFLCKDKNRLQKIILQLQKEKLITKRSDKLKIG